MDVEIIQINKSNSNYLRHLDEDIFDEKIDADLLATYLEEKII